MKVPLTAKNFPKGNAEFIQLWYNGKSETVQAPIKPYFYSEKEIQTTAKTTRVKKIRLSDYKEVPFYKHEFNKVQEVPRYRRSGVTYEDNIPFLLRVRVDRPDFYTKFKNTNDLKFLFLDIEQFTDEKSYFPTYKDRIISIAYCSNDRKMKYLSLRKETKSDGDMLKYFIRDFAKIDPDVIVLYNKDYDIPTIIRRCEENNINTVPLTRDKSKPYIGGKYGLNLPGRVIYDAYDSVKGDQSLSGNVPNRGLKAVSDYFGFKTDIPVIDTSKTYKYVGTKELKMYNIDDVKRLLFLFDIYFTNLQETAEQLKIPLSETVGMNTTDLGIIVMGEMYQERNVVANGLNYDRYPEIFQRKDKEGGNYQGALTGIKRKGLFRPIIKADYSSMYPNIVAHFNLSPDTCSIVTYERYGKNNFKIVDQEDYILYYIPDNRIKRTVVLKVLKEKGFLSKVVKEFLDGRSKYKRLYKETGNKNYKALSDIEKVKANGGVYGTQGSARHPFGCAPIALATTGLGRVGVTVLIQTLEECYPNSVIEWDTDGVYLSTEGFKEKEFQYKFDKAIKEKFHQDFKLDIGYDYYDAGYFHLAKNYILKKDDVVILHGAAMKGSHRDDLSKNFIHELAKAKIEGQDVNEVVRKYQNLQSFPLDDFVMTTTQSRHLTQYKSKNSLSYKMALKAQHYLGLEPKVGNSYHYVKTIYGYDLLQNTDKTQLDYKYYKKKVKQIIEMFKAEFQMFKPLSSFMEEEEETKTTSWDLDNLDQDDEEIRGKSSVNLQDFY